MQAPAASHRFSLRSVLSLAILLVACVAPHSARAASADSASVECMLPGEIHNIGGHPTMGARRSEQTTAEDCRERGGEYTVQETAPQAASPATPVAGADDGKIIACLLPRQTRQLGEKATYKTTRHTVHTTRTDCQKRGGDVYTPSHTHHATTKK
ncbi:MAG TPA: hypothetical protein VK753_01260 [Xanthomonadaceae bacterium]|nr:hypothetical protein [Xanthomonadaceae bacterium]